MSKNFIALVCGILFGLGLAIAGMTNPLKVLAFLDLAGNWDASLLFVLGSAVMITTVGFHFVLKRNAPVLENSFHLPIVNNIDSKLIIGSVLFGIGWGISGYCPGPAIALLAAPNMETLIFIPALFFGFFLEYFICRGKA